MNPRLTGCVLALFLYSVPGSAQKGGCAGGEGTVRREISGSVVTIQPLKLRNKASKYPGLEGDSICRATISSRRGKRIFSAQDETVSLLEVSGKDLNGDGAPDVAFEGYSGAAHCCWSYWIVSLGRRPGVVASLQEEMRGIGFADTDADGRIEMWAQDGTFDYFDSAAHTQTVFPTVVLRLENGNLRDVNTEFRKAYDSEISDAQKGLTRSRLLRFRERKNLEPYWLYSDEYWDTWRRILTIVLAYLYSGREWRAWKALHEMWPRADQDRMQRLIIRTRAHGILRYVSRPKKQPK